jgi:hypothetical protein
VRLLAADDDSHPGRPALPGQIEQVGDLGDVRPLTDPPVGAVGLSPALVGDVFEGVSEIAEL